MSAHARVVIAVVGVIAIGATCVSAGPDRAGRAAAEAPACTPPAPAPSPPRHQDIATSRLMDAAETLRAIGATDPAFANVEFVGDGHRFAVYRAAAPDAGLEARYRAATSDVTLTFRRAQLSSRQVADVDALVMKSVGDLRRHGVQIASTGPDTPGPYVVGYTNVHRPDPALLESLQRYGPGTVTFRCEPRLTY